MVRVRERDEMTTIQAEITSTLLEDHDRRPGASPMWRRIEASLAYERTRATCPLGVRSVTTAWPRLIYVAYGIEVDLEARHAAAPGRLRLLGQVTAGDEPLEGGRVSIVGAYGQVEATLDEDGQFVADGLRSGGHRIEISLPHTLIELPSVHL